MKLLSRIALAWAPNLPPAPLVVEHVRYVKKDAISPRTKAHAMAMDMKRYDLAAKLEGEL